MVFRSLVRNWLHGLARQKVREELVKAARQQVAEAGKASESGDPASRSRPCDVGVVFALPIEAGGLEDLLDDVVRTRGHGFAVCEGVLKGRQVVVVQSGAGCKAARHATDALISGHRPQWVISAGLAGGLSPELKRHALLMADGLANAAGTRLSIDLKVDPAALARTPGVHVGRLLTVDRVVRLPGEKRSLGEKHQAVAVDMESFAAAEVCRHYQTRFLAVRIISDAVDEELPADVQRLLKQKTRVAKLGALVGATWRRPSSIKDVWKLKESALICSSRLGKFLASTIEQLVASRPACD
jgi:adenosylhomocysteine nucleosidase